MRSERRSLYIRSVPMLPDPTMAAVTFSMPVLSPEVDRYPAEGVKVRSQVVAWGHVVSPGARAGQYHVTGLEFHAEAVHLVGQPGDGRDWVAEHRPRAARCDDGA